MGTMAAIWEKARKKAPRIALPEADDPRIVEAAATAAAKGLARPILVGDAAAVEASARQFGLDSARVTLVDPARSEKLAEYARILYERRKHKGMVQAEANRLARDPLYFGALMVAAGDADGLVAGASATSADVLRALLWCIGKAEDVECVSSAFLMIVPGQGGEERVFIFADAGVVPDPSPEQLASIAIASARTGRLLLSDEPCVAMLSFSTAGSAQHSSIDKVRQATEIARRRVPGLLLDGELQVDAAIVPAVAKRKAPGSPVAGRANILVFPNLDAANIGYKLVERLAGARAIGPLLQGLRRPASDLSRGCSADDIVNVIAMVAAENEG